MSLWTWDAPGPSARKEFIHIRRDPHSLIMIMLLPVIQLLIYGYALTFNIKDVPVAIYNRDQGHLADKYLNEFRGSPYFKLTRSVGSSEEIDRLLAARQVRLGLVFPHDFTRLLHLGRTAPIQALVDGAEPNAANVILGYVQSISADFNQKVLGDRLNREGLPRLELRLKPEWRFWFNEDLESINFIVPGLIVVIMTMVGTILSALSVVREVERGTMESLFATSLEKSELLLGKLLPYFCVSMLVLSLAMLMGHFLFEVPLRGSLGLLIGAFGHLPPGDAGPGPPGVGHLGQPVAGVSDGDAHYFSARALDVGVRLFHPADAVAAANIVLPGAG